MTVPWAHHLGRGSVTGHNGFLLESLQASSADTEQCASKNYESFVFGVVIAQERRGIHGITKTTKGQGWFRTDCESCQ